MPKLSDPDASPFVKIMLIGDSGAGKTGALLSLVRAGYNIRIVDMDSGVKPLAQLVRKHCPDKLGNVEYETFRDKYKSTQAGMELDGKATAYTQAAKTMDKWPSDESRPSEWGKDYIYVVDSFTMLGRAAMAQAKFLKPTSNAGRAADGRQLYGMAQEAMENFLACLFGESFATNVIVISHITDIEMNDGTRKGFPSAIGQALSRNVARYFNDLFVVETKGKGENVRRIIRTVPNAMVDAKTSALDIPAELPIDTGLATIFEKLRSV